MTYSGRGIHVRRSITRSLIPTVFAGGIVMACEGDSQPLERYAVVDSAGIEVVVNRGGAPDRISYVIEMELGVAVGDTLLEFGQIGSVRVGSDGTIYALDRQARGVRVFSSDGQALSIVGRPGRGPGEFSAFARNLIILPGDTVLVPDVGNTRIARFVGRGEWLESLPVDPVGITWAYLAAGRLVFEPMPPTGALMVFDPYTGVTDRLIPVWDGEPPHVRAARERITMLLPPWIAWTALADGRVAWGRSDAYRIHVHGAGGELERIIAGDVSPRPLGQGEKDALRETWLDYQPPPGFPAVTLPPEITNVSFGEVLPLFARLLGGHDGALWVQHVPAVETLDRDALRMQDGSLMDATEWDVFDHDGRFTGVAELPPGVRLEHIGERGLYGIHTGPLGEHTIVRLVPAGR